MRRKTLTPTLSRTREREERRKPRRVRVFACLLALAPLTACAATQSPAMVAPAAPGFWLGLWHGFIFPVAWLVSLFADSVAIYAVPNNGGWYDFGYFLGIVVFGVGARKSQTVYRDRVVHVPIKDVSPGVSDR